MSGHDAPFVPGFRAHLDSTVDQAFIVDPTQL
jgi:hypothetical protein